jgi:hypothetical protein
LRYSLLCALLLLTACGGGGSSTAPTTNSVPTSTPLVVHTFADFFPLLTQSGTAVVTDHYGNVYSSYSFVPGEVRWGESYEEWAIAPCTVNGKAESWVVLLGFKTPTGPLWESVSERTTWDDQEVICSRGAAYGPMTLVPGVHTIRQWGIVAGTKQFYWQAEYTFGQSAMNVCWQGPDPQRPVLGQREVWQDRAAVRYGAPSSAIRGR